jgi:glutamate synthase domain-containing protein 3
VLGSTGRNFAAGMSGGIAFVFDRDGTFRERANQSMCEIGPVESEAEQAKNERELVASGKGRARHLDRSDESLLREMVERHLRFTGSTVALAMLDNWEATRAKFLKVFPNEYRRALTEMYASEHAAKPEAATRAKAAA